MSKTSKPQLFRGRDAALLDHAHERSTRLHRVRRGIYTDADAWRLLQPWERHAARVEAVAMTWDAPVFCLESAATRVGLPLFGETRDIHLVDHGGKSRRYGDVVVHATVDELDLAIHDGFATTSFIETALALCRVLPPAYALATADHASRTLAKGGSSLDFSDRGRERSDRRGRRRLEWVNERATGAAESFGESVSRAVIEWLGFDTPDLQEEFAYEGVNDRTDFYWRQHRIIGESDGYGKYDASDAEAMKAHFINEKIREDRLRRYEKGFARWDWVDNVRYSQLGDKLYRAGLRVARPQAAALLATLAHNRRAV